MKKFLTALAFVFAAGAASAVEVGVSHVFDYNLDRSGARVAVSAGALNTSVTNVENKYTRVAVGTGFNLVKVGNVTVGATVAGVYQDTVGAGANGYGITGGLSASVPLAKNVDLVGTLERFAGQERVNAYNGTTGTVGLVARF